ncbi:MAG: lolD [Flavipsychrobacter sp.]|jgi:lipoprotein-releasing system ATP-binding protein|nr:lolD [Flavipsychrobacter sp.]
MMADIALRARNITKYFHDPVTLQVLKNISFEVTSGEFVSIVGKSGCGKSTLLYVLSTMDTDYEGELEIQQERVTGRSLNDLARIRNESIGFVFQFHYLLPDFTCLKNVMIPALRLGRLSPAEIEEKAYEKLKLFGVEEQALKRANKLSGGQQQRVAIARALINDPAIIMGDEPTGNLDSKNTGLVFDLFQQLSKEYGQTLITVTHDEDFARRSDRTIVMADGEITSHGK